MYKKVFFVKHDFIKRPRNFIVQCLYTYMTPWVYMKALNKTILCMKKQCIESTICIINTLPFNKQQKWLFLFFSEEKKWKHCKKNCCGSSWHVMKFIIFLLFFFTKLINYPRGTQKKTTNCYPNMSQSIEKISKTFVLHLQPLWEYNKHVGLNFF